MKKLTYNGLKLTFGDGYNWVSSSNLSFVFDIDTRITIGDPSPTDTMIIPTNGTDVYDFDINWGDGVTESYTGLTPTVEHTYDVEGIYTIKISGIFPQIYFNNSGDQYKVIKIDNFGKVGWKSLLRSFLSCRNIETIQGDNDFSQVNSFNRAFCEVRNNKVLDCTGWDVTNATDFTSMFYRLGEYTSNNEIIGLETWNVSNAINIQTMFGATRCATFDISNWDVSNVENMSGLFSYSGHLNNIDLSLWNVSKVTNMSKMFHVTGYLTTLDISNWNVSEVTNMSTMFNSPGIVNLDISKWDISKVTSMTDFMANNTTWLDSEYDKALIAWSQLTLQSNVSVHFGDAKYSAGAAATSRQHIIDTYNWTIIDGGLEV